MPEKLFDANVCTWKGKKSKKTTVVTLNPKKEKDFFLATKEECEIVEKRGKGKKRRGSKTNGGSRETLSIELLLGN